jgi:hypothetical protein
MAFRNPNFENITETPPSDLYGRFQKRKTKEIDRELMVAVVTQNGRDAPLLSEKSMRDVLQSRMIL